MFSMSPGQPLHPYRTHILEAWIVEDAKLVVRRRKQGGFEPNPAAGGRGGREKGLETLEQRPPDPSAHAHRIHAMLPHFHRALQRTLQGTCRSSLASAGRLDVSQQADGPSASRREAHSDSKTHSTTVLCVRKDGQVKDWGQGARSRCVDCIV